MRNHHGRDLITPVGKMTLLVEYLIDDYNRQENLLIEREAEIRNRLRVAESRIEELTSEHNTKKGVFV